MKEIEGNLITLAEAGEFDVIAHGCNCFCVMGAGIAPQMARAFGADKYKLESERYRGDYGKMGNIDYKTMLLDGTGPYATTRKMAEQYFGGHDKLYVVNAYTQYAPGVASPNSTIPLDYGALGLALRKINKEFSGLHIGLPLIGCGLAGGDWDVVKAMFRDFLPDMKVTVVHYDK